MKFIYTLIYNIIKEKNIFLTDALRVLHESYKTSIKHLYNTNSDNITNTKRNI